MSVLPIRTKTLAANYKCRPNFDPTIAKWREAYRSGKGWYYMNDGFDRLGRRIHAVIAFNPPPQLVADGGIFECDGQAIRYAIIGRHTEGVEHGKG